DDPVGPPPGDGVPSGPPRGSVCRAGGSHLTCPSMSSLHGALGVAHLVPVSRLSARAKRPYPPGYGFPLPFGGRASLLGPCRAPFRGGAPLRVGDWAGAGFHGGGEFRAT